MDNLRVQWLMTNSFCVKPSYNLDLEWGVIVKWIAFVLNSLYNLDLERGVTVEWLPYPT